MPTTRKRRSRTAAGRLSEDQEQHLLEGWCLDCCIPWHRKVGFPFKSEEHRREVWEENRDYLLSKCPPGTIAAAARQYDGDDRPLPSVLHHYAMGLHRANE